MHNYINSVLLLIMALGISSCGGGGATSGDPLGTDTITISASVTSLKAGENSIIKATVKKASGTLVTGRSVSFFFRVNNSGGTISVVNDETQGNGEAIANYTAGANSPANSVQDTIQVSLSNDSTDNVVITRVAGVIPVTPPPPADLTATAATSAQINFAWTASAGAAG